MRCTITEIARRVGISKAAIIQARNQGRIPESIFGVTESGQTCIADAEQAEQILKGTIGFRMKSMLRMPRC
jgi:ribosomal protein L25 (general stress protein Ctc)